MADEVVLPEVTVTGEAPTAPAPVAPGTFSPSAGWSAVSDEGQVRLVKTTDLEQALASGSKPATEAEYFAAKGGAVGRLGSAAIGAARGATFGLSDLAAVEGSRLVGGDSEAEDTRRALNLARQANPTETLGGELVGSLAGMAILPGGGATGAVRGTSAFARAASRVGQAAPRLLLEGAGVGIAQQATEDLLGNHDRVAQQYVAAAFKGAALSLLIGGALNAGGGALMDRLGGYVGRAERAAAEATEGGLLQRIGQKAADEAEMQAFKATGAKLRAFEQLGATAEAQSARAQRIGRRFLDDELLTPFTTQEKLAQRVKAKLAEVGGELGTMRKALDKAEARPAMSNIVRRFEDEILKPALELPLGEAEAQPAARFVADMVKKGGETPDFATLFKYRRALDLKLERGGEYARSALVPSKVGADSMRSLRAIIEDEFEAAAERAAAETGESFAAKYKLAKEAYSDYRTAQKILAKEIARGNANQAISLTDVISTVGGVAADGVTGLALGAANKIRRTFGNQIAAHALDQGARLAGIQRTVASVDESISKGVRGFLTGEAKTLPARAAVTEETARAVREAVRDPDAMVQRIDAKLGDSGLNEAAPKVAQAVAATAMRAASYFRDRTPKEPPPSGLSFVPQPPRKMADSQLASFARAYEAVTDPMSIVEDLEAGRLDREKVTALKRVYPELYAQIRKEVIAQSLAIKPELTEQQQIQLSILFEAPISAMMQPKNIQAFQKTYAQGADPTQSGQAGEQQPAQQVRGMSRVPNLASGFDQQEAPK